MPTDVLKVHNKINDNNDGDDYDNDYHTDIVNIYRKGRQEGDVKTNKQTTPSI